MGATLPCFLIFIESCHCSLDQSLMEAWISFLLPFFGSACSQFHFQCYHFLFLSCSESCFVNCVINLSLGDKEAMKLYYLLSVK